GRPPGDCRGVEGAPDDQRGSARAAGGRGRMGAHSRRLRHEPHQRRERGRAASAARDARRRPAGDGGARRLSVRGAMKYVDEFRNPRLIRQASDEIRRLADPARHYRIMEVCGGHTHAIYRFALADLLPPNIELVHGPGCPVCVLPMGRIDEGLSLVEEQHAVFTTFGDVMRVPGRHGSPLERQARGADIRMVYSPLDALRLARENPDRHVVFFAIGFETTAPSTALTLKQARALGVENFSVFSNHVTIVPAIRAILDSPDMRLDAFVGPGHVSTVIGARPYAFIARDYARPVVIAGFEPLDLLQSIVMILRQLKARRAEVENQYSRVV